MLNSVVRTSDTAPRELDFDFPVVNIGSHPENDIILTGASILPFHATVQSQNGQFSFFALGETSIIKVGGLQPTTSPVKFSPGQPVEIGGYVLTFQRKGDSEGMHVAISGAGVAGTAPEAMRESGPLTTFTGENPIIVNLINKQAEVQVGQTAEYDLELINAGLIVAGFTLSILGIPESWVKIEPPAINLFEGQHGTAHISVTPPRSPESKAGLHDFDVIVSSENYANCFVQTQLSLNILPYYEFTVGNISPRQARIHWRKHTGIIKLPISNASNSDADFNVTAFDDENGCSFDIQVSQNLERSRQATVNIPAGQTTALPIGITPLKRPIAALRNKSYHYTATAQIAQQPALSQAVSGTATSIPLFGWWTIVVTALLAVVGLFLLLQPRIYKFEVASGKDVIVQGDSTALDWSVSPFATTLSLSNIEQAITRNQVSLTIVPAQSTTYDLVASNWLSGLFGLNQKRSRTILVVPPKPVINVFEVDRTIVPEGIPINIRWSVSKADKALLTIDKVVYELKPEQFSGEQQVVLAKDALVTLEAVNASGSQLRSYFVKVVPPKITVNAFVVWVRSAASASLVDPSYSRPTLARETGGRGQSAADTPPDLNFPEKYVGLVPDATAESGYRVEFFQPKRELSKGEQVMIQWDIEGAENDQVKIAPFTDVLPSRGAQPFFPQESMNFVMTATSGKLEKIYMLPVKVFDGTPPVAPKIEFFQVTPAAITGPGKVQFAWSVSGEWTRIQLFTEDKVIADYLNPQGFKTIDVSKSGTYILTACNGTLCSSSPKDVTVNPALIDPGLIVASISPTTGRFQIGAKLIVTVQFTKIPAGGTYPTGTVTVTDGGATCTIPLPAVTCNLQFTTSGTKTITASFPGDKIYQQSISPGFAQQVVVASAQVDLIPSFYFVGSTSPVSVETSTFDMDKGIETIVEVRPKNTVLADDKGNISVSLCDQDANEAVIMSTCVFVGSAQVKVADTTTTTQTQGYGYADIVITNFIASGIHGLLFEYTHSENAIDPTSKFQPNIHINRTRIALSLSSCTDPYNFVSCTYGLAAGTTQELIFDLNTPASTGPILLSSLLPAPQIAAFSISSVPSVPWTCSIKVMSGTYKYDCKVTGLLSGTTYRVTFDYDYHDPISGTTVRNDYYMGPDSTIPFGGFSFDLQVLSITKTVIGNLTGVRVGDKIKLTGPDANPGIINILDGANNRLSPFPTTGITLTEKGGADIFGVAEQEGVNCTADNNGSTITVKAANADCYIYFKHVGNYTLSASFAGDANNNASTSGDMQVAVQKQTQINGQLRYMGATGYVPGIPINMVTNTASLFRVAFTGPASSFSPDSPTFPPVALSGRKVLLTLSGWGVLTDANGNPNCWVDTSTLVADQGNGVYEITLTQQIESGDITDPATLTYIAVADFTATCSSPNSLGLSYSVVFSDQTTPPDSDDYAFAASVGATNIAVQDPSKGTMSAAMIREDTASTAMITSTGPSTGTVSKLHFGQKYDLSLAGNDFPVTYQFYIDHTYVYHCPFGAFCVLVSSYPSGNQATLSQTSRTNILNGYNTTAKWTVDPSNFLSLDPNLKTTTSTTCGQNMALTSKQNGTQSEASTMVLLSQSHYWDFLTVVLTNVYRETFYGAMNVQVYTTPAQQCVLQFDSLSDSNTPITTTSGTVVVTANSGDDLFAPNNVYTVNGIDKQAVSMAFNPTSSASSPLSGFTGTGNGRTVTISLASTDITGGTALPFVGTSFSQFFSPNLGAGCSGVSEVGNIATSITETYSSTEERALCTAGLRYLGNKYYQETLDNNVYLKFDKHQSNVALSPSPAFFSSGAFSNVTYSNITVNVADNDSPAHSTPVPGGTVKFELLDSGGNPYDCSASGKYTLTASGATCDATAKTFYNLSLTSGSATFSLLFKDTMVSTGNKIRLTYSGDTSFATSTSTTPAAGFEVKKHNASVGFTSAPDFISSGVLHKNQSYTGLSITVSDADNPSHPDVIRTGSVTLQVLNSAGVAYVCGGTAAVYSLSVGTCTTDTYTISLVAAGNVTSAFALSFVNTVGNSDNNYIRLTYSGDVNFQTATIDTSKFGIQ